VDDDGSMTIQLGIKIYLANDEEAKTIVTAGRVVGDLPTPDLNLVLQDKDDLEKLDYQLGDEKTSNLTFLVVNEEEVWIFHCHSRVLIGKEKLIKLNIYVLFNGVVFKFLNGYLNLLFVWQIKVRFSKRCLRMRGSWRRFS